MLEHPTIILLDNSLKMHGCNSDNHTFYELAGDYLMTMTSDKNFVEYPPGWFSSLTIIRNGEVFNIKDKEDFIDQIKYLSADLTIAFNDQVKIWKDVVNKITDEKTNVYILTTRVEKTIADWFYEHQINVGIIDLSKGAAEVSKDRFNGDDQEKQSILDAAKQQNLQQVDVNNTVLDFGMLCIGDSPLQCINTETDEKLPIQNIRIYGATTISNFTDFPILAVGKFEPSLDAIYSISKNFGNDKSKTPAVTNNFNNLENFNNVFDTIDSMTIESDAIVVFLGKAYCRETKKYFPALLKSSSLYVQKVKKFPYGRSGKDLTEDENLSLDGCGEGEPGLKRGPRYFEVQVLGRGWPIFKDFVKFFGFLLTEDDQNNLDRVFPGLTYDDGTTHHSADGMSVVVHRMIRALKIWPVRTAIYEKETETMCDMIKFQRSKSYGMMIAKLFRSETDHLSSTHKRIAKQTANHFVTLANKFQ